MTVENFVEAIGGARQTSRGWLTKCPAHADRRPSLSISEGDDRRILLKCWANCTAQEIISAMGLSLRDLFPDARRPRAEIRKAENRRAVARKADKIESQRAAVFREAERIVESAKGIDISEMAGGELDALMDAVGDARLLLAEEKLEEYRYGIY